MKHMFRLLVTAFVLLAAGVVITAQTTDYFTEYPGGFTESNYQITTSALANPIELSWVVEETEQNELIVTTTNRVTASRGDLELGVLNGIAEAQLIIQSESVRALLENPRSLTTNSTFIVPGGAQFQTGTRDVILGIDVICGVLTDPGNPNERTLLAITADPTLPFPPFIRREVFSAAASTTESLEVCRSLESIIGPGTSFRTEFFMEITYFERRE